MCMRPLDRWWFKHSIRSLFISFLLGDKRAITSIETISACKHVWEAIQKISFVMICGLQGPVHRMGVITISRILVILYLGYCRIHISSAHSKICLFLASKKLIYCKWVLPTPVVNELAYIGHTVNEVYEMKTNTPFYESKLIWVISYSIHGYLYVVLFPSIRCFM